MVILRQKGTRLPHAQIRGDLLNVCKVIVQGSTGKILGAHWLGIGAEEGMGAIALAMQKNLPISDLAHLSTPAPGAIDTLRQIVQQWQQYRLKTHPRFTNLLESWCNFRRG
jgi:pyruvate/2-oxoglutarate dehydrogenase complex dihydrolipoamide dehydrogenase (E3) component